LSATGTDHVTILRSLLGQMLAKAFAIAPTGQVVKRDWPDVARYRVEAVEVCDLQELLRLLRGLERDARACVIRGEPVPGTDLDDTRRKKVENGGAFADVPRRYIMLDLDGIKLPAGTSVIADPGDAARIVVDLIAAHVPELDGVSAIVQFSSSAGLSEMAEAEYATGLPRRWDAVVKPGGGIGAHVWYWLDQPVNGAELDRWAAAANARIGHRFIDPATLRTVQPHYTAGPVFDTGLRDPLAGRRTLLIEGETDAATLDIPAVKPRRAYQPGEARQDSRGFRGWLDAIGGLEGFHDPINRAIAAFVAVNWPNPDTDALKAALAERILSADPGDRSQSQIERYASDAGLEARIAWTMGQEQAKRAAQAEASAAAAEAPVAPTYRDRGVPLDKAYALAAEAIRRFSARVAAGEVPQLLLAVTVGGGKTFSAIDLLPEIHAAGKAAGRGPVLFTHPRHALGDQIAADILARHPGLKVAVYRGMDAEDPTQPGAKMCQDPALPAAARAAGQGATHGCGVCPLRDRCSYLAQAETMRSAAVIVAPHQVLFMAPFAGWPRMKVDGKRVPVPPSAVIADEDITGAGLAGLDPLHPIQLALSALQSDETPNVTGGDRERLLYLRRKLSDVLLNQPAGPLFADPLQWMAAKPEDGAQLTAGRELANAEWDTKPRINLRKGTTRAEAMAAYADAATQGFTKLRPLLAERIADFLTTGDARSVSLTMVPEAELGRNQGTGPAVRMAWRQDFHRDWSGPMLFLDATARPEILQHWAPQIEVVDIEVQAPHQRVVQVADREFSRTMLTRNGNASRLVDLLMVELATAGGEMLVVAQMAVERLLRVYLEGRPAEGDEPAILGRGAVREPLGEGEDEDSPAIYRFPSGAVLHLAHHGAVTGSNAWAHVTTMVVIGRPATNLQAGERLAEVISGRAVELAADATKSQWPETPAGIRMADGTGRKTEQPYHPDPLVEAVRWSITEGAVLQAAGRPRGVRRTADKPVRLVLLNRLALPLTVAEVMTWDEALPDRLTVAVAEAALFGRAMPLAPADMSAARPDFWATPKAAERFLEGRKRFETPQTSIVSIYRGSGGFKTLQGARYRKGLRGRWSQALVPLTKARAALEAALNVENEGPLSAFELVAPPPPTPWSKSLAAIVTALHAPLPGEVPLAPASPPPQRRLPLLAVVSREPAILEPGSVEPDEVQADEPAVMPPASRLEALVRRLEFVRPPRAHGDGFDLVRELPWRDRQAVARALWSDVQVPPAPAARAPRPAHARQTGGPARASQA
jgi:hypothetical protein